MNYITDIEENSDFYANLSENDLDMKYNSELFSQLFDEDQNELLERLFVDENDEMMNDNEEYFIDLSDNGIDNAECRLNAYGMHVNETDDTMAYNHKTNPDKAIDVLLHYIDNDTYVEIFLDTNTLSWDSFINGKEKLSPDQMEQFFNSSLYNQIYDRLINVWPKTDNLFSDLLEAITNKKYKFQHDDSSEINEDENEEKDDEIKTRMHNVKLGDPNEKNTSGKKIRSSSGRKLINFTDNGVVSGHEKYYSWPGGIDDKHKFKWSRWCDWEKQKPFLRCRFTYNIGQARDVIGCSLTLQKEDDINRGFICYNLSLVPRLQYLTPEETEKILNLSIIRRFLKIAYKRIHDIVELSDEEIYKRVNKPEKCTLDNIRKTKSIIKNTLKIVKEPRPNTFIYTN